MGCGHGFCQECMRQIPKTWRDQIVCPICRFETSQEPRQIYIEFAESTVSKRLSAMEKRSPDSPAASVGFIVRKIKKEAKAAESRALMDAAQALEKQLCPVLASLEREKVEKAAILDERNTLKSRLKEVEPMRGQVVNLTQQLRDKNQTLQSAMTLLENTSVEAVALRKERARLKQLVEHLQGTLREKNQTLRTVEASQENKDKQIRALRTKLRGFAKQGKQTPKTDGSKLQIETSLETVQNTDSKLVKKPCAVKGKKKAAPSHEEQQQRLAETSRTVSTSNRRLAPPQAAGQRTSCG
ncbi:hypothetical protein LshimejAT787_0211610 [Lyophyllum shimeji]|uniref:RING-type domain-containing protein n=1 Tax=Lyophyllum shimeji TaxID=47721 RepID=A0A9P3PHI6_LYOSH|nr:hypothetical protein LshimejAT787_0211610 [Lyophyllum shimeji]